MNELWKQVCTNESESCPYAPKLGSKVDLKSSENDTWTKKGDINSECFCYTLATFSFPRCPKSCQEFWNKTLFRKDTSYFTLSVQVFSPKRPLKRRVEKSSLNCLTKIFNLNLVAVQSQHTLLPKLKNLILPWDLLWLKSINETDTFFQNET